MINMFVIDEDNGFRTMETGGDDALIFHGDATFATLEDLGAIAESRSWSKDDVTKIWNQFACTVGFEDCKSLNGCVKNRGYGLKKIWAAIQRLDPAHASQPPETASAGDSTEVAEAPDPPTEAVRLRIKREKAKKPKAAKAQVLAAEATAKPGSNLAELIRLISRKNGASVQEVMDATGWTSCHTVRGRLSILGSKGMSIIRSKHPARGTVYTAR